VEPLNTKEVIQKANEGKKINDIREEKLEK
jgi:hypothetical protein